MSYKRRHDEKESEFFEKLEKNFAIEVVAVNSFPLVNIKESDVVGLYILRITPKSVGMESAEFSAESTGSKIC